MSKRLVAATVMLGGLTAPGWAQLVPLGPEFQVNTYTTGAQRVVSVAMAPAGNFVAVWDSFGQDGNGNGVFGQKFDASGRATGAEFGVNTHTTGLQGRPAVAFDGTGNFVVVWDGSTVPAYGTDIWAQRYNASGVAQGANFRVNTYLTGSQLGAAVAVAPNGDFVVAWESSGEDGNGISIRACPFNAQGVAQNAPFQVNAFTTGDQRFPSVALNGAGEFVVTWQSADQDLSAEGVFERRFDWPAAPLHGDLRVNTYTIGSQHGPVVARNASGNFMIAWTSVGQDGSANGIFAQALDAGGSVQGPNFQVNTLTDSNQSYPAVAADGAGSFLVTWSSSFPEGDGGIYARKYGPAGTATSPEFHMNTYTTGRQAFSSVAAAANGKFVVVWESSDDQDGDGYGIFGQLFGPDLIFGDGFEGIIDP